ncbi:MAG: PQQ-binding-like beta-propeller repeat protein [Bacteroidales bacterium]|nr:PQQ-binding-like beta-propeller repeat protein [Bacteroidales bacterium]
MKRLVILALAMLAVAVSCKKQSEKEKDNQNGQAESGVTLQLWARTPADLVWHNGDAIGLYTSDDFNSRFELDYLEAGKEDRARFNGKITRDAAVFGAYFPFDTDAGERLDALRLSIPEGVKYGDEPARFDLASYQDGEAIAFTFVPKLATVKLVFDKVSGTPIDGIDLKDITITGQRNMVGLYSANLIQPSQMLSALNGSNVLSFDMNGQTMTEGLEVKASIAAMWKGGDKISVSLNEGEYTTELTLANSIGEGEELELTVSATVFNPVITLDWVSPALGLKSAEASEMRSNYPAVDDAGNVYVQISKGDAKLYKLKPADGSVAWSVDMGYTPENNASPSCEADGSVVYALGGSSGSGRVMAVNGSDGLVKWTFGPDKFFGNGSTPAPNFNQVTPAIGETCIYVGNAGTAGTVLAIDKTTGERVAYVSDTTDGIGGPAGGAQSGVGITAGGEVAWVANYGIFTADKALLDAPVSIHDTYGAFVPWAQHFYHGWQYKSSRSGIACSKIDGVDAVWATVMEQTTSGQWNLHVICSKVESGKQGDYTKGKFTLDKKIENVTNQDQGGIVIGPQGEAVVALKGTPGSIKGIMPNGDVAYSYTLPGGKDVTGACAVDNNGFIHIIGDESGGADYYAIVRPDYVNGTCEPVAVADLNVLVKGVDMGTCDRVRAWTSVVLGKDGKMYIGVTAKDESGNTKQARVMRLSFKSTKGPSSVSPWPQRGADACHSGNQK